MPSSRAPATAERLLLPHRRQRWPLLPLSAALSPLVLLLLLLLLLQAPRPALAQYAQGTNLFVQTQDAATGLLKAQLQDSADLENVYYPNKYLLPTDYYSFLPPDRVAQYTQNVIFNPCQGYEYNCCFDTYGTPEYQVVDGSAVLPNGNANPNYGLRTSVLDDGSIIDPTTSRLPDDEFFIDNSCTGVNLPASARFFRAREAPARVRALPLAPLLTLLRPPSPRAPVALRRPQVPRTDCVMSRVARRPFSRLPRCWNRNDTLVADGSCRSPVDGSPLPLCIELGVTQTNFIVECANEFQSDPHCGTFLEVHRPGFAEKLGEARLRAMYPSGYRMTVLSTTYKGDTARTLCFDALKQGRFELWWVQRTRYNFVVERRIPFSITSPQCDWDDSNNRYLPYATLFLPDGVTRRARELAGLNPFDPKNLLFTRQRVEGTPAFPGVGMGSTLVPIGPDTYPPGATFDASTWHNAYTYAFAPLKPDYTVSQGVIAPSSAEQTALALLTAKRGYRRLEDAPPQPRHHCRRSASDDRA